MTHAGTTYRLLAGRGLLVRHFAEEVRLAPGVAVHRRAGAPAGDWSDELATAA